MLNGRGLRVVLWVSGCVHQCEGCHNELTWDSNFGLIFDRVAESEVYTELEKEYISGVTFSGGDPLHPSNIEEITRLAKNIKERYPNKNIWLYTGYKWEDIWTLEVINYVDVLVDGKFNSNLCDRNLKWVGSSNQRVIDVKFGRENNLIGKECRSFICE